MTDERQKKIYSLFTDCWRFFKECHFTKEEWERGKDRERWGRHGERAKQLVEKYGEESVNIVIGTMELIENSEKEALRGISQYRLDPPVYRKEDT